MTSAASQRTTVGPRNLATAPLRLSLRPPAVRERVLDGGWWPRSRHPGAELPGLIAALTTTRAAVIRVALHVDSWSPRPRSLAIDGRVVCLVWSMSLDPHQLVVTAANGDRTSLLIVPPHADKTGATAALAAAGGDDDVQSPSDLLVRALISLPAPGTG